MKAHRFTSNSLRSFANWLAMLASKQYKLAAEADKNAKYFKQKTEIMRDFLLNSPWILYTIMYFSVLLIDAFFMRPIIGVVVAHGFLLTGRLYLILFVIIYVVLVSAMTIGAAYGFAKLFDSRLRDLQVELNTFSQPGITRTVIFQQVQSDEKRDRFVGIFFTILLAILLISLSLYRDYLTNDFRILFVTPADWLNLILPITLAAALVFFGIYKDTIVRKIWFENRQKYYEKHAEINHMAYEEYSRQAMEQEIEAVKNNETTDKSADLEWIIMMHKSPSVNPNFYNRVKAVLVIISNKGTRVEGVQVTALTDDECSIYSISEKDGSAKLTWQSDCDFIKTINIGKVQVPGTRWFDGDIIRIDLSEFMLSNLNDNHQPKLKAVPDSVVEPVTKL
ncbi:MAG: hypothetical protein NTX61_03180 [Bacteroidetes bacterium]|nr:hypothetical protein [Bacteroidota bacterium]